MEFTEPSLLKYKRVMDPNSDPFPFDIVRTCDEVQNNRYACDLSPLLASPLLAGETLEVVIETETESYPGRFTSLTVSVDSPVFDPDRLNNTKESPGVFVAIPFTGRTKDHRCFVATAAYGTPWEPRLVSLRRFRDDWLLTNTPGRAFVGWYYANSPLAAEWISERDRARAIIRGVLTPMIFVIENPRETAGLIFTVGWLLLSWRRRSRTGSDASSPAGC